jgi:hypothetical protein
LRSANGCDVATGATTDDDDVELFRHDFSLKFWTKQLAQ